MGRSRLLLEPDTRCLRAVAQIKFLPLIIVLFLSLPVASAAGNGIKIVTTTFPIYQLTKNITHGANGVFVDIVIQSTAGCPHDYNLTPSDARKISFADIMIINGLGLDNHFTTGTLPKGSRVVDTSTGIKGVLSSDDHHHGEAHHASLNPHLFASPQRYASMLDTILSELIKKDKEQAGIYIKNAQVYKNKLQKLANDFSALMIKLQSPKVVAQHDVFNYLAVDSGFEVIDSIQDHPGEAPSAARIIKLIHKIKAMNVKAILVEPQFDDKYAKTISRESQVHLIALDPVASGPSDAPLDYYEKVMQANMENLNKALGALN